MSHLTDRLEDWAARQPETRLYTFLDVEGREIESYTYAAFLERTIEIAAHLSEGVGLRNGDRVLLVYPPGLEIIAAFFACARVGAIAVPVYPPTPMGFESGLTKLAYVARDCGAKVALTTRGFHRSYRLLLAKRSLSSLFKETPALPDLEWRTTDDARGAGPKAFRHDPHPTLFLQYTSGSTSDPKGVVVSHANVLANAVSTLDHRPVAVSWLPQYHDMGFIGYYMYPMITGGETHGFSPLDFLKRPALWMETISRVRGTITSAPNFAYDYCLREDKVPDEALRGIDLGSLEVMMNAAEPVRADTFRRFRERFEAFGLRPKALMVAYGLAEATLAVSLYGKQTITVNKARLQQRDLHVERDHTLNPNQTRLVSCGRVLDGVEVRIVEPETREALTDGRIGEIWLAGTSKCEGYWNRPDLSREVFGATIAGSEDPEKTWLRTGDLGFLWDGELFVCGRVKDLIIIRGVNYYPQDIEAIVEAASPEIRKGCCAAFAVETDGEALVVVAEVHNERRLPDAAAIARAIRTQYYVEPHTIAFVRRRSIPKTTSGKLARNRTREAWIEGGLDVVGTYVRERPEAPDVAGLRDRFRYIVELYNLTGREQFTFPEIGIDSLTLVSLIEDMKDLLVEHGMADLVDAVDVRLLQKLKVAQFFDLLDAFEKGSGDPIPAYRDLLRMLHEEHDAQERERMRADARLEILDRGSAAAPAAVSNVLFTGATGFFGPFLLAKLLSRTSHTFHVLIRATDPVHGRDRIRAALRRARLWTPALDEALDARVRIVCGDLSRERLGLSVRQWEALAENVQAICHNGALVNYVMSYEALRPHNVDGTRELLRLAYAGTKKRFHLVSSTFIFGWTTKDLLLETDSNEEMAQLDFGYAQSKWVAEQLALEAGRNGLDVRIYRPSLLSASTGGVGSRDDIAIRLLAFMIRHGVAVDALNQISFLPADVVADNVAAIFDRPVAEENTFHITANEYYNFADVTKAITRLYGYAFEYHDIPRFIEKMNERCTQDDPVYPLLDFFNRSHPKIEAMQHKRYDNERYRRALADAGDGVGDPPLDAIVTWIVEYMREEGILGGGPVSRAGPSERETAGAALPD